MEMAERGKRYRDVSSRSRVLSPPRIRTAAGTSAMAMDKALGTDAVAASPLIVSTDIRNMTDIMKKLLLNAEVIAVNQQVTAPGDVVGARNGRPF